jgi:hypothetical protein
MTWLRDRGLLYSFGFGSLMAAAMTTRARWLIVGRL